ncbi:type IV secretion system protein B4, putative [Tepidicaulis marinus]|uniref:Type IV secretion system protein B4, putative n=1 Tax=Tepidicaulis marinus TaxID=1333998 RepID=A0A081BF46_9HYPH|nr:DUF87 domain-containing protein [Tepidicaulis marinus]GAK46664.1 type IV secretion system protein B4, putative [Tepidicaulis marinus]
MSGPEFASLFDAGVHAKNAGMGTVLAFAGAGAATAGAVALATVESLRDTVFGKTPENSYSDFIPFLRVLPDDKTVECKDGSHFRVFAVTGIAGDGLTADEVQAFWARRKSFLDALNPEPVFVRFVTMRRHFRANLGSEATGSIAAEISSKWAKQFERSFANLHFIVVSVSGYDAKRREALDNVERLVRDRLSEWSPAVQHSGTRAHELERFLYGVVNGRMAGDFHPSEAELAQQVVDCSAIIDRSGAIRLETPFSARHQAMIGIRGWPEATSSSVVSGLMAADAELSVVQIVKPIPSTKAQGELAFRLRQTRAMFGGRFAAEELEEAADRVGGGQSTLLDHQLMVIVEGNSEEEVQRGCGQVMRVLGNHNINAKVETASAERMWWTRVPGLDVLHRPFRLDAENVADLWVMESQADGIGSCDWGEGYVRLMPTSQGSAYRFNFHRGAGEQELGHFLVFGGTGAGKSTLMAFWILGALEAFPDLKAFLFDRNEGFRAYCQVHGFEYVDPALDLSLNPFHLEPSQANLAFLTNWLTLLAGTEGTESQKHIEQAVGMLMQVPTAGRSLKASFEELFPAGSEVKDGLRTWAEGSNAYLFNGAEDSLSFDGKRLVAFDMTDILDSGDRAAAMISYIAYRIRRSDTPHLIMVDEAAPMLENKRFASELLVILREARKKQGVLGLAFQDPGALTASGHAKAFLQNTSKRIFFRNTQAQKADFEEFDLTDSEWQFIKGTSDVAAAYPRAVLIKSDTGSVILNADLSSLGNLLRSLTGGSQASRAVAAAQRKGGEKWLDMFLNDRI